MAKRILENSCIVRAKTKFVIGTRSFFLIKIHFRQPITQLEFELQLTID